VNRIIYYILATHCGQASHDDVSGLSAILPMSCGEGYQTLAEQAAPCLLSVNSAHFTSTIVSVGAVVSGVQNPLASVHGWHGYNQVYYP